MPESLSPDPPVPPMDRSFVLLLAPLAAASLPSLAFCALALVLHLHTSHAPALPSALRDRAEGVWDHLFAFELSIYQWVARWNSVVTLAATAFFVSTLLRPRWRHCALLALIPYIFLLCADFTLRWL
jgi:hypothetical protein